MVCLGSLTDRVTPIRGKHHIWSVVPLPCLSFFSPRSSDFKQGSIPRGTMSCRIQGIFCQSVLRLRALPSRYWPGSPAQWDVHTNGGTSIRLIPSNPLERGLPRVLLVFFNLCIMNTNVFQNLTYLRFLRISPGGESDESVSFALARDAIFDDESLLQRTELGKLVLQDLVSRGKRKRPHEQSARRLLFRGVGSRHSVFQIQSFWSIFSKMSKIQFGFTSGKSQKK